MVSLGRAVVQKPGSARAVGLGRQQLGPLVGGRRRTQVDALDVLGDVQQQGAVAQRSPQPGIGPLPALVARHVEAGRAAEAVRADRVEVRRRRLLGRWHAQPVAHRAAVTVALRAAFFNRYARTNPSRSPPSTRLASPDLVVGAVVLDHRVRVQHVGADLRAEVHILGLALLPRDLLAPLTLLQLEQLGAQHRHRLCLVRRLRALVLALDDDARGPVRDAHRGVGLVDVLAAGAAGPVGVDLEIVVADLDVGDLVHHGRNLDSCKARVAPVGGVEGREAHQPVNPLLAAVQTVGVLAPDEEGRRLDRPPPPPGRPRAAPRRTRGARPSASPCAAPSRPSPGRRCRRRRR